MATREEIEEIRARANIVTLASRYLALKKSGKNFLAICPFHPDKKPSLAINPEKNLFHCFGCGEGGDVFKFLMKIEKLDFPEAVRRLAEELGVKLQEQPPSRWEKLKKLNERVCEYFQCNLLQRKEGRKAKEYLREERGFTAQTIAKFKLGYALPGWDNLLNEFRTEREGLEALGLIIRAKDGGYYDRFRDRIMFTIFDLQGRVAGFAGRALRENQEGEPKYINTPRTPLFEKGEILYGLNFARQAAPQELVLMEGYTDVIAAHQAGITNTVASMGTALTERQAQILRRYIPQVIIAYDRDAAGRAASLRGMRSLRNAGLEVKVALLPVGEDPDSLIKKRSPEAFIKLLEEAIPFHKFYLSCLLEEGNLSLVGKERILKEAGNFLRGITSLPLKYEIIRELAEQLNLPEEEVELELKRGQALKVKVLAEEGDGAKNWGPEEHVLYFLLQGDLPVSRLLAEVELEDFSQYHDIISAIFALYEEQGEFTPQMLLESLDAESQRLITKLALTQLKFSHLDRAIEDSLARLKLSRLKREMEDFIKNLKRAEQQNDTEELARLQREYFQLKKQSLRRLGKGGSNGRRA